MTAWRRILGMFRRRSMNARLDEEVSAHLELLAEQFEERGMDPEAARQAARREFGGITKMQESYREQSGVPFVDTLLYDFRLAARSLFRDRFVFTVCVVSLGLAVGAGTAIFSAYEAAVLRPLPFPESENLALILETSKRGEQAASLPNIDDWRERSTVFSSLSAVSSQTMALSANGAAERVRGGFVSHEFFQTLRVDAAMGSVKLLPRGRQAVISHRLWKDQLGGRQDILGAGLFLNGEAYSVLGVLRPEFVFPTEEIDVWVTSENYATSSALGRDFRVFYAIGRLRAGISVEGAGAALRAVAADLAKEYPRTNDGRGVMVLRWRDALAANLRGTLHYLLAAAGLLLFVACSNVGGMLAARAAVRRREFAMQTALGAPRGRIVRQLLLEGFIIGSVGSVIGLLTAYWALALWPRLLPSAGPAGPPAINGAVLGTCLALSILAGLVAGLLPALGLARAALGAVLGDGGRNATAGKAARIREGFLVVQVATAMVLILGGAALLTNLVKLLNENLGISEAASVLTMEYRVNRAKFSSAKQQWEFHRQVVEGVKEIPGVRSAALARAVPYSGNGGTIEFRLPGQGAEVAWSQAVFNTVTGDYFRAMGISVLSGRSCSDEDVTGGETVVLVNELLARRLWPNGAVIGQTLMVKDWANVTVIGVVGGNRQNDIRREPPPQIYACYSQNAGTLAAIVMRVDGDMKSIADAAKKLVWRIDSDQAVWKVRTMQSLVDMQTREQRTASAMVSIFAVFAGFLALFGAYGIARYDAARRLKDLGIRLALGARRREIFLRSVGRTLVLVTGGVVIGGALGPLLIRKFANVPLEGSLIALCGTALVSAGCIAASRPGLLALRTNPVDVLRHE